MNLGEIKTRAFAVRLRFKTLAEAAGLHSTTVSRRLSRENGGNSRTLAALEEALMSDERRLGLHILNLHPDLVDLFLEQRAAA